MFKMKIPECICFVPQYVFMWLLSFIKVKSRKFNLLLILTFNGKNEKKGRY